MGAEVLHSLVVMVHQIQSGGGVVGVGDGGEVVVVEQIRWADNMVAVVVVVLHHHPYGGECDGGGPFA